MNSIAHLEPHQLQQLLGARDERILQLEQEVAAQRDAWECDAMEWKRLERHRRDLAEWLVDGATDQYGKLIKPLINASLGGELFVPCTYSFTRDGRPYRLELVSTEYDVREGADDL